MSDHLLPNELLLHVFSFLTLKSLIFSRSANHKWRQLVPEANIQPARRALLEVYDKVIKHPHFLNTRASTLAALTPKFDREAYVANIEASGEMAVVPEEFRIWILEWPEKALFGWVWPELKYELMDSDGGFVGYNILPFKDSGTVSFPVDENTIANSRLPPLRPG